MFNPRTFLKVLTIISMVIVLAYGQSQPKDKLTLRAVIYDQHKFYNPNFQPKNEGSFTLTKGIVKTDIDLEKRIPVLNSMDPTNSNNTKARISWPDGFQYFFVDNQIADSSTTRSGKNLPIQKDIDLIWNGQVYEYSNSNYFPINKQGFNNASYPVPSAYTPISGETWTSMSTQSSLKDNNYNFCLKLNSKFTFSGSETFKFTGDDDVWVYINNKLVVDIGGIHSKESASIDLTTLGLTIGNVYNFDFFYCERKTTESNIQIQTTIETYCAYVDYCGVCEGDGTTCCSPATTCNDGKRCTNDFCPDPKSPLNGKSIKDNCIHSPVTTCSGKDTLCKQYSCSEVGNDLCVLKNQVTCPGNQSNCESAGICDDSVGCINPSYCTDYIGQCHSGKCSNGACVKVTPQDCENKIGSVCRSDYYCDPGFGCKSSKKCKDTADACTQVSCNSTATDESKRCVTKSLSDDECKCCDGISLKFCQQQACNNVTGFCDPVPLNVDDGNLCTIDTCNEDNKTISHVSIECGGCESCSYSTGKCAPDNSLCNDNNICTNDICVHEGLVDGVPQGKCANTPVDCGANDNDKCKIWTCDPTKGGCQSTPVLCEDKGKCLVGKCQSSTGQCKYSDRICDNGGAFCIIAECDQRLGCLVYDKVCASDNSRCQEGVCVNGTDSEEGHCKSVNYDPLPFVCKTAAVVSTAVIAGVTIAGAVALGAFIYGGKRGYEYWKDSRNISMGSSNSNPLYEESQTGRGINPMYDEPSIN
ncbi:hypothetical protein RB653_005482 [Dictyostelium firmibasis]|uniref:PA14 domain-containing protein n=1 Tax=Dictyostelium firmibasis TaxID=79012 RepID=A0AAN7UL35_9MYCE